MSSRAPIFVNAGALAIAGQVPAYEGSAGASVPLLGTGDPQREIEVIDASTSASEDDAASGAHAVSQRGCSPGEPQLASSMVNTKERTVSG
jgi:hypothetical protein